MVIRMFLAAVRGVVVFGFFSLVPWGSLFAQVSIVANNPASNQVALGGTYTQDFNTLPASGSVVWSNNSTLPGWYANLTRGQVSTGNMTAETPTTLSAVNVGSVGGSATLNSLGSSGSSDRALGGTPSAYTTGSSGIFSSKSVNAVLRVKNSTGGALTGMKVAYDTVATSTNNRDAIAFAYRVFSAGQGTITTRFLETHKYLNTYNGNYEEGMRTEYGNDVDDLVAWKCVVKEVAPTSSNRTNNYDFFLRDLNLNPGEEIWLAWHIAKENEQGSADAITTTAIDNVSLSDFTVGRPGVPTITLHPRNLSVATSLSRDAKLSVEAKGATSLSYQWRKDGVPISGGTNATHNLVDVTSSQRGSYDVVVTSSGGTVTSLPAKVSTYSRQTIATNSNVDFSSHSSNTSLEAENAGTLCDLYYPINLTNSSAKVPAIIIIHGGGGNNGTKIDNREVQASQELAARGWFVMNIDYAMSSSTEQCWPVNLWDAKQAVRWLKQKGATGTGIYARIDTNKIGVCGFSWGCNMGSMLAMTGPADDIGVSSSSLKVEPPDRGNSYDNYSTEVQCSAVFYGAADLPNYHQMNQFLDDTAWNNRTLYRRASPVRYPNKSAAPMLMVHGTADDDVWPSQTESTYMMQRSQGARLEPYLYAPGGEHSYYLYETSRINANFPNPLDQRPEVIGFFEKYLVETSERPAILTEPLSRAVTAGDSAAFTVEATGTPGLSYQWRKDGANIVGATSATYTEASAGSSTSGYYDVLVSTSAGTITSAAALLTVSGTVVQSPVVIDASPVSQSVGFGQTARFTVSTSGTEPITYQWRKGGVALSGQNAEILDIANVGVEDAGSYDVYCSNVANGTTNTVTSSSAQLTVVLSQAIELTEATAAGNQITFSSGYSQTFANLPATNGTTNWFNETILPGWSASQHSYGTNAAGATNSTNFIPLTTLKGAVTNVSASAGTWYSLDNAFGYCPSTGSGPGFLVLRMANQSQTNLTGMNLIWDLRNGGSRAGLGSNSVSVSYLTVPNGTSLDPANASSYPPSFNNTTATASNGWKLVTNVVDKTLPGPTNLSNALAGLEVAPGNEIRIGWHIAKSGGSNTISAVDNVRLTSLATGVIGLDQAPEILAAPASLFVASGTSVQLKATAVGRPTPQLQWYKGSNALTDETTDRFGIPEVAPSDTGIYKLVASNSLGLTNTAATLTVADVSRTSVGVISNNQAVAFDFSTISNSFNSWFNYGLIPGVAAFNITNTSASPIAFTNYANWPGTLSSGTLVLASTSNGLALGGVGSSTQSQMLVFRMANRSAGPIKGFRVNFTALALTNASGSLKGTLAASYKFLDSTNTETSGANFPPNFASTSSVASNNWMPLTNLISSNVVVPASISQTISQVNILPDQEIWVGFYLAKPSGDTHFLGVKDVSVDQFTVESLPTQNQTITFGALPAQTVGAAPFFLSATASSGLPVSYTSSNTNVATVSGNAVTVVASGTTFLIASQIGDATYLPAVDVTQELVVGAAPAGTTFATWSANATLNSASLALYAIGGGLNLTSPSEAPRTDLDSAKLSITAIVRTNDGKLSVIGEAGSSLTNWSTNGVSHTVSDSPSNVPTGCQRQVFSIDRTNGPSKLFLRLKAVLQP